MWYTLFKYALFRPYVVLILRPRLIGAHHIPERGGAVLAANHLSSGETFALPALIRRPMVFPAKRELFEGRGLRGRIVAWFLSAVDQVPMDRAGGRATASALAPVIEALREGRLVGIFPEGTRSMDGRMYRGHTGVARLVLEAHVPVVPIGMIDTPWVRNGLGIPTMRNARMVVGEPLDFSEWYGQENNAAVLRWVTNEVMAAIQQLTGQTYVDLYGSRAKHLKDAATVDAKVRSHPNEGQERPEPGQDSPKLDDDVV